MAADKTPGRKIQASEGKQFKLKGFNETFFGPELYTGYLYYADGNRLPERIFVNEDVLEEVDYIPPTKPEFPEDQFMKNSYDEIQNEQITEETQYTVPEDYQDLEAPVVESMIEETIENPETILNEEVSEEEQLDETPEIEEVINEVTEEENQE